MHRLMFHSPPTELVVLVLFLCFVSVAFVVLGIVFLVRHAKNFSRQAKLASVIVPGLLLLSSLLLGYTSTFPFGLLSAFPIIFAAGPGYEHLYPAYVFLGCLLNALGFFGLIYIFRVGGRLLAKYRG